jgi:hypothetical protein
VLTIAGLIVAGRIGLQSDDLRAFLHALELMLGVPLASYGVVAGAHTVSRAGARFTRRLDRQDTLLDALLEGKGAAEAARLHGRPSSSPPAGDAEAERAVAETRA